MKFALHCAGEGVVVESSSMDELWVYVRENGLCSEEIFDEELPARRVLNASYRIHTIASVGELIAMSRMRWTHVPVEEWSGSWPDT